MPRQTAGGRNLASETSACVRRPSPPTHPEGFDLETLNLTASLRLRSTELTEGRRWQIFWAAVIFFIAISVLGFLLYLPQSYSEQLNVMAFDVVVDCILDSVYAVIQITMFLFYWEAKTNEQSAAIPPSMSSTISS